MHTCNRSLSPHMRITHQNHIHPAECTDVGLDTKQNWLAISSSSSTVSTYLDDLLLSLLLVATVHSKSFITTPDPSIPTCTYKIYNLLNFPLSPSSSFEISTTNFPNCFPLFISSNKPSMPSKFCIPSQQETARDTSGRKFFAATNLTMSENSRRDPIVEPRSSRFLRTAGMLQVSFGEVVIPYWEMMPPS